MPAHQVLDAPVAGLREVRAQALGLAVAVQDVQLPQARVALVQHHALAGTACMSGRGKGRAASAEIPGCCIEPTQGQRMNNAVSNIQVPAGRLMVGYGTVLRRE